MVDSKEYQESDSEREHFRSTIDWPKVVTNSISTIVGAIVLGAGLFMWNAAIRQPEEIRTKVEEAKTELQTTQTDLKTTQEKMADELASVNLEIKKVNEELSGLRGELGKFAKGLETEPPKEGGSPKPPREWFKQAAMEPQWSQQDFSREKERILSRVQKK